MIGDDRLLGINDELRIWLRGDVSIIVLGDLTIRMAKHFLLDDLNRDLLPAQVICVAVDVNDHYDETCFELLVEQVEQKLPHRRVIKGHPFDAHTLSINIKSVL